MTDKAIKKIKEVWETHNKITEPVQKELYLDLIEQVANLFSVGSFYYYIFNFESLKMEYVDKRTKAILGVDPADFSLDSILSQMHPEDIRHMHEKEFAAVDFLFNRIPKEQITSYKVVYLMRLKHCDGTYRTILHQSKTLTLSGNGKVQQVLGIHTDVSYLNLPIDHKISFISDEFPSYYSLETGTNFKLETSNNTELFTPREKEIILLISQGKTFNDMATILNVSPHTVNTHKKNILKKSGCNNTAELVAQCIRNGVI